MEPRRWVAPLFLLSALTLLPWTIALSWTLPEHHSAQHWRMAWVGFDVALGVGFFLCAIMVWRRSLWLEAAAAATGALLLCDAWFDVLFEHGTAFWAALLEAVLVEIPLAVVCFWIARDAEHFRAASSSSTTLARAR